METQTRSVRKVSPPLNSASPKPESNVQLELRKIRREVLMLSDRAKKLADRIDVLITEQGQDLA
jgi:hypothetical protein